MAFELGIFDDILMIISAGVLVTSLVITSLKLSGDARRVGFSLTVFAALTGLSLLLRNLPGLGFTEYNEMLADMANVLFILGVIVGVYTSVCVERHGRSMVYMGGMRRH
ncbi:hypothetical protein HY488_02595 [Candidatus Woesearchaeota archaeon]|nr:hypothetical protein [Candidatus Woesearchaeota archaeon]